MFEWCTVEVKFILKLESILRVAVCNGLVIVIKCCQLFCIYMCIQNTGALLHSIEEEV
jgi:hypothetical protein